MILLRDRDVLDSAACCATQDELSAQEKNFVDTLDNVDNGMDRTAQDFRTIDSKTSGLSAAAATTGAALRRLHSPTSAIAPYF